ncbi:MAG: nucleotide sugar dehydrogenase [Patescibacteria group bacterium]|jgi:nucleotide sugar dehydrogenase
MKNTVGQKTVCIIGLGYVGLPLALLADKNGYITFGIDTDFTKVKMINQRNTPFSDEWIKKSLRKTSLVATTDFNQVKQADVIAICVPTPVHINHKPNLDLVESACCSIGPHLKKGVLVILESTVNPGVTENIILPILEGQSKLICGEDFYLAHCPERINPGDKKWNIVNIPRIVGSFEKTGLARAVAFYRSLIKADIKPMGSLREAEAVKVVENSFRDINIAFVNELAMSFSLLGIDIVNVIDGAATKPFAFLPHYPGCGVGGHCIPVDPYYLIEYAKENGFHHKFLTVARKINNRMPKFTVEQLRVALRDSGLEISGVKVAILGLSYKPEVDDCRESPALAIIRQLEELGASVITYDPHVIEKSTAKSLSDVLTGAQAVVIVTAHAEFRAVTPSMILQHKVKIVVDGRNCLDKDQFLSAGVTYVGIGR